MRSLLMSLTVGLAGLGLHATQSPAQTPFYQGKQLVVLVNFSPGGPTDAEGRLLARHLPRLVGGNPTVVVTNMSGSNGALGANWLANAAAPDGLVLGYFTGIAPMRGLGEPMLSEGVSKHAFVAAGPGISVTYARTDLGGGIKKAADLLKVRELWVGGVAPDNDRDIRMRMQLDLLGIKHQYQTGFAGTADARVAFQRGDIQMFMEPLPTYRAAIESGPVSAGAALPIWIDPIDDGKAFYRSNEADGIPALTFTDSLVAFKGTLPNSQLFDAYRLVNQMGTLFQRILVLAPGAPPAAVTALRSALNKLRTDAEFGADAMKSLKFVPTFLADEATERQFKSVVEPEPAMQAFIRAYVEKVIDGRARTRPP